METKDGRNVYTDWTHELDLSLNCFFIYYYEQTQVTDARKYFKTQMNRYKQEFITSTHTIKLL